MGVPAHWRFPGIKPTVGAAEGPDGWLAPENRTVLARFLSETTRHVVELGSWRGLSTRFIADRAPKATVYAIDTWLGASEHHIEFSAALPDLYDQFIAACWNYRDRIIPCRADTITGLLVLKHCGVIPELIYVDASHDYESVRRDVRMCRQLFPTAQLVGDDWWIDGVRRGVSDEIPNVAVEGSCWWFDPASPIAAPASAFPDFYCVHVASACDRRIHIERQFDLIGARDRLHFVAAPPADSPIVADYYSAGASAVASCFAGHLKALRTFLETAATEAIICEDDVCFHRDFAARFATVMGNVPRDCSAVLLSYMLIDWPNSGVRWSGRDPAQENLITVADQMHGAQLYWISRAWATEAVRRYDRPFAEIAFATDDVPIRTSEAITINSRGLAAYPVLAIERPNNASLIANDGRTTSHERISAGWGLHNFYVD